MNILPINNYSNTSFNGKVITKGNWPKDIDTYFKSMPAVKQLAENSEFNIIGKMHRKLTKEGFCKTPIMRYRLDISAEKENPNLLERIKSFLGFNPKYSMTQHHHRGCFYPNLLEEKIKGYIIAQKLGLNNLK